MVAGMARGLGLAAALGLAVLLFGSDYAVHVASRICVFAIAAIGLDLVSGWLGQISLGHAAFMGIGAYVEVIAMRWGLPSVFALLAGLVAASGAGALLALPATRLFGPHIAIATLGFQVGIEQLWARSTGLSGGRMGLPTELVQQALPLPQRGLFVLCWVACVAVALCVHWGLNAGAARDLVALRDEPVAAEAAGLSPLRTRALTYAASGLICGLAGTLFVGLTDSLHPEQFGLSTSLELLVMVMVGGAASVRGAVLGAGLVVLLGALLGSLAELQTAAIGGLLLVTLLFWPQGLSRRRAHA